MQHWGKMEASCEIFILPWSSTWWYAKNTNSEANDFLCWFRDYNCTKGRNSPNVQWLYKFKVYIDTLQISYWDLLLTGDGKWAWNLIYQWNLEDVNNKFSLNISIDTLKLYWWGPLSLLKVRFLQDIGIHEEAIGGVLVKFPPLLTYSLYKKIRPVVSPLSISLFLFPFYFHWWYASLLVLLLHIVAFDILK